MTAVATEFSVSSTNISLTNLGTQLSTPVTSNIALAASFYGQSAVTLTSFSALLDGEGNPFESPFAACAAAEVSEATWYHDGSGSNPTAGDAVYTNSGGTSSAPDGYIRVGSGRGAIYFLIEGGESSLPGVC